MKIAIIGSGISGLTAAYLLHKDFEIDLYEQNDYVGGHSNTVDVEIDGNSYAVDTGFIVFNQKTYPNFVKLLKKLDVGWKDSIMSFSVHCARTGLEYSPSSVGALFAQKRNILKIKFWRMLWDIFRFRRNYESVLHRDEDIKLIDFLKKYHYSQYFIDYFIIPMGAAIWSADPKTFGQIPAKFFIRFFHNHGFLNVYDQPQWLTVQRGSRQYVKAIISGFRERIHLKSKIVSVRREEQTVELQIDDGSKVNYDHVIIASHSDQALNILSDPSDSERQVLESFPYKKNETVLHTDSALLPGLKKTWASWNYFIPSEQQSSVILTYNMNMLQSINCPDTICVTLNAEQSIDPAKAHYKIEYSHPVYDIESTKAQQKHKEISGVNRTHYCGAYWGNGFHEDGVNSALAVCKYFGKEF